jgi:hypothetical protein
VHSINTDPAGEPGKHWLNVLWRIGADPRFIFLEPLDNDSSQPAAQAFRDVFGKIVGGHCVRVIKLAVQLDSWSCGYWATWLWLYLQNMIRSGLRASFESMDWEPPPKPPGFNQLVWTLLEVDEVMKKTTVSKTAAYVTFITMLVL